jgi:hypothetical protein
MKPKYLFYLILLAVMHYEVGRLVNDSKVSETDESSYEQSTKFTPRDNELKYKAGPPVHVFKLHNNPKKKYYYKNI